jgi:Bacterial extracellular solute-binding protein/von Willebrand factor type A domain
MTVTDHAGKHSARRRARRARNAGLALLLVAALATSCVALLRADSDDATADSRAADSPGAATGAEADAGSSCEPGLAVVTSSSFAPVLDAYAGGVDEACPGLDVSVADGAAAVEAVSSEPTDLWIPEDASWVGKLEDASWLAAEGEPRVVAVSPIHMVTTDADTRRRLELAGSTWLGLNELASGPGSLSVITHDPGRSSDAMVALGNLAETVWIQDDMDASAASLAAIRSRATTLGEDWSAVGAGEVALVPEYAVAGAEDTGGAVLSAGSDYASVLRYAWLPAAAALEDPSRSRALDVLGEWLGSPAGAEAIDAAGLRRSIRSRPPSALADQDLPDLADETLPVLEQHHVEHVFATWYPEERRSNLLMVVDVSGSMGAPVGDSDQRLIDVVLDGVEHVGDTMPDDASLELWEFGSGLDGSVDHRVVFPPGQLSPPRRDDLRRALDKVQVTRSGTGLYDTILAAYREGLRTYDPDTLNHVAIFTDGINEDDPDSITAAQLTRRLASLADDDTELELTIIAYGEEPDEELLVEITSGVDSYVEEADSVADVEAAFIHIAAH